MKGRQYLGKMSDKVVLFILFGLSALTVRAEQQDQSFTITDVSCWEIASVSETDRLSALLLVYGFVAGKNGMAAHSGLAIESVLEQTRERCANSPDLTVASVLETAMVNSSVTAKTAPAAKKDNVSTSGTTVIDARRQQELAALNNPFTLTAHRPNYILPATFRDAPDYSTYGQFGDLFSESEIKFQLSFKSQIISNLIWDSSLEFGYTQQSYWQLYADSEASAPFRESNHEPELLWRIPLDFEVFGARAKVATLAFTHQSNGQIRPLSRSWNRMSGEIVFEKNRWVMAAQAQTRVDNPDFDDNPNVADFMGRVNLSAAYKFHSHTFALGVKSGMGGRGKAGAEFNWMFPLKGKFNGFFQLYHGYGENLIDMEQKNSRIGFGIALNSWL